MPEVMFHFLLTAVSVFFPTLIYWVTFPPEWNAGVILTNKLKGETEVHVYHQLGLKKQT